MGECINIKLHIKDSQMCQSTLCNMVLEWHNRTGMDKGPCNKDKSAMCEHGREVPYIFIFSDDKAI
jgi:hypothetical protein